MKKRGRPPKTKTIPAVENEKIEKITMTNNSEEEYVSINDIHSKWQSILKSYSDRGISNSQISSALSNAMMNNPFLQNERLRRTSSSAIARKNKDIQKALESPQSNEQLFREESLSLSFSNYVYHSLLNLYRDIPFYNYYYTPKYVDKSEMKTEKFRKESRQVDRILKSFKVKQTLKKINKATQVEGKTTWLVRTSYKKKDEVNFFVMQKLDSDMVKLTGFGSDQSFVCSFNFMIFLNPAYSLELYPPVFTEIFNELVNNGIITTDKKGNLSFIPEKLSIAQSSHLLNHEGSLEYSNNNYLYWVKLPQNLAWTFSQDESHPNCFPDTIGLFMDFSELGGYRWIQSSILSNVVSSILTAEVPYTKDAKAGSDASVFAPDTIIGFENLFKANVSNTVLPFFAPFNNYKLFTVENQPENLNIIYSRLRDLIATSGTSSLLGIAEKPTVAMTAASKQLVASQCDYLTRQFENFLNHMINNHFDLQYDWKITLWGDAYHWKDELKIDKELLAGGMTAILPKILSASDMTLEDCICTTDYIEALGIKIQKEETSSLNEEKDSKGDKNGEVGRNPLNDEDVDNDNTAISKDAGNNVSELKEYKTQILLSSIDQDVCVICGKNLNEYESYICDECLESQYEERIGDRGEENGTMRMQKD